MQTFYLHLHQGAERFPDREGYTFVDLAEALDEARQIAIECATDRLRSNMAFPRNWSVQIEDAAGHIAATFKFDALLGDFDVLMRPEHAAIMKAASRTAAQAKDRRVAVQENLEKCWSQLAELRDLFSKFPSV